MYTKCCVFYNVLHTKVIFMLILWMFFTFLYTKLVKDFLFISICMMGQKGPLFSFMASYDIISIVGADKA